MAHEQRVRGNLVTGTISVALAAGDTTMTSAGLANLPAVTATGHSPIIIENEIVYVTAHTAAATTATILRGQEGTSAASHGLNTAWVHGPVASDFDSVLGYAPAVTNQAGIAAGPTDLTSLTLTVTIPYAQHRIRILGHGQVSWSDTSTGHFVDVLQDGVDIGRVFLGGYLPNTSAFQQMDGAVITVPTVGSHTFKLTATRYGAGTGTFTLSASATNAAYIMVEDMGPAA